MKNELVVPVATLNVTEMEYAVIKALLFWEVGERLWQILNPKAAKY